MAITQETILLNEFGFAERRRTTSSGTKSRFTISIKADVIPHVFDAQQLGRGPAEAIAAAITRGIKGIGEFASLATQKHRATAARSLAAGAEWAVARYSGGRTGMKQPNQTKRLFNDSERLAEGIFAQAVGDESWTVNVPANRFDPSTFGGGVPAMQAMVERLQALVPALRDGNGLANDPEVKKAVSDSIYGIIAKAKGQNRALRRELNSQIFELARRLAEGLDLL
jgi:hypothetical protein